LDYLIFDACSMASVEVLYEIKDKARYILASPTEVVAVGLPYHLVMKDLFANSQEGLIQVAKKYYAYYNAKEGIYQSATIALIDTRYLEHFALQMKALLEKQPFRFADFRRNELQGLDFIEQSPSAGFDLMDFLAKNFSTELLQDLQEEMERLVLFKAHTARFNNKPIQHFSGLSCYVPSPENKLIHPYYKTLSWYQAGGFYHLFNSLQL